MKDFNHIYKKRENKSNIPLYVLFLQLFYL